MSLELFSGIAVADFTAALAWYERLLGTAPTFFATETEAVWELAEHRWVYVVQRPEHAGHALLTVLVADLDAQVAQIASRGLAPDRWETHEGGVRKATFIDPEGNEVGFGDATPM